MARISKGDLQKLTKNIKFKGEIRRGVRWAPSRKDKAENRAWTKKLGDRLTKENPA